MDATERDDDFAPVKNFLLAAGPDRNPGGATPLEHKAGDCGISADAKIGAAAHIGAEIADRRRGAF